MSQCFQTSSAADVSKCVPQELTTQGDNVSQVLMLDLILLLTWHLYISTGRGNPGLNGDPQLQ